MNKDFLSGLVLLAIAALYSWATGLIADSTLSDEVGASGLPRVLAFALAGLGMLLLARALLMARRARPTITPEDVRDDAEPRRAIGLLLFGAAYVLLIPVLGYLVCIALLIAGIAVYERARLDWRLPITAIGGSILYWAIFSKLLGVNQPAGALWQSLFS